MTKLLAFIFVFSCACMTLHATNRYTDIGDGTVIDTITGFMWLKDANPCGEKNWEDSKAYCSGLVTNGYSDWRLPDITNDGGTAELDTLGMTNGLPSGGWEGFAGAPFTNIQTSDYYWSFGGGYSVKMSDGSKLQFPLSTEDWVWPVRGPVPLQPVNPVPANNATNQLANTIVSWGDGGGALGYKINFGTTDNLIYISNTIATNYDPGALLYSSNYQWRIDATNTLGVITGTVWAFTISNAPPPAFSIRASSIHAVQAGNIFRVSGRSE